MNWEDWPPMATDPIGFQANGVVNKLFPPGIPSPIPSNPDLEAQLAVIAGGPTPPPTVSMSGGVAVTEGEVLSSAGYNVFVDTATSEASLIESDGTTTEAPADGTAYPLTVS